MSKNICKDSFWNNTLFYNKEYPMFTECFQFSLLLIPTLLSFCSFLPWLLFRRDKHLTKIMQVSLNFWYVLKISSQVLLLIFLFLEAVLQNILLHSIGSFDYLFILSYFGLCLTLIIMLMLTELRRRKMNPISLIIFIFWASGTFTYMVRFYSNVCQLFYRGYTSITIAIICISGVSMFLFILSLIMEWYPIYMSFSKKTTPCPEIYASIFSKLTYFWLDKYIYRWHKNHMTEETVFDVRDEEEATKNTDLLESTFLEKMKNKKLEQSLIIEKDILSINLEKSENELKTASSLLTGWIFFVSLLKVFVLDIGMAWAFKLASDCFLFTMPFLLKILIKYVNDKTNPTWQGYCLAVLFIIVGILASLTRNLCLFISSNVSIRVRAAIIGMVYRKTLRLSNEVRREFTSGEIVNLMSVDAERVMNWVGYSWFIFSSPFQIGIALIFLYNEIGFAVFAGLGLVLICFPLNALIIHFVQKYSEFELKWKDKRVKLLNEILNGIKVLKMYAWEPCFITKIRDLRRNEVKYIRNVSIGWGGICLMWDLIPFFVMLVTFTVYIYSSTSHVMNAEKAFVSLALFNLLKFPMITLPWGITETINASVSITRLGEFLCAEEVDLTDIVYINDMVEKKRYRDIIINVKNGTFSWRKGEKAILNDINIEILRGKLIAVVGRVGTGKSSLLSAILGEMIKDSGVIKVRGKIAYVPQEAWIQNKTLKENILFIKDYDKDFYDEIIETCCLHQDLESLPGRDEIEIGERGINLSGGQKQRVNLARAVYQNRDIYLLDDPLSAVDAHVGQHIFDKVISNEGILKSKTRILVTHGLNWLPKVDEVIVLNENGEISQMGTFQDLITNSEEFKEFVQEFTKLNLFAMTEMELEDNVEDKIETKAKSLVNRMSLSIKAIQEFSKMTIASKKTFSLLERQSTFESDIILRKKRSSCRFSIKIDPFIEQALTFPGIDFQECNEIFPIVNIGQLIDDEATKTSGVKFRTYYVYLVTRGAFVFILMILAYILFAGLQMYGNIWLKDFVSDPRIIGASEMISKNVTYTKFASRIIRDRTNYYMMYYGIIGISQIVLIAFYCLCFTIGNVNISRRLHSTLLDSIMHSPMSFFDTTPTGRILNRFSKDMNLIDHTLSMNISDTISCFFLVLSPIIVIIFVTPLFSAAIVPVVIFYYMIQWFYMPSSRQARRLDSISTSPVFNHFLETLQGCSVIKAFSEQVTFQKINETLIDRSSKFKFIQFASTRWLSLRLDILGNVLVFCAVIFAIKDKETLSASLVGLSIAYSLQITETLNWLLRQYTELETNAVAVERVLEYSKLPSEAAWEAEKEPDITWPDEGNISFVNFKLRYREGLPIVLNGINIKIEGGQRVGVVGRSGAGKSSLNLALFRLVEPAAGQIIIDSIDIRTLGLHALRRKLTILPQDPVIFSGSLKENLDPFGNHTESELLDCIEKSHLKQWFSSLEEGLNYDCGEGGGNLSAGQKQLLCLARAILRKTKVLILDEATAAVDIETDSLVMETIRKEFDACTVIIIAHRIHTILDTDSVIVLDHGQVIEYANPSELLKKPKGIFRSLASASINADK